MISDVSGNVDVTARICNDTDTEFSHDVLFRVLNADGVSVCECTSNVCVEPYSSLEVHAQMKIDDPVLWELDAPYLYTLRINAVDTAEAVFGVRDIAFDSECGFILNGKEVKMWGACVHQDFGGVGVALTDNLQRYKIQRLKEMGVNAYRASHNPPAPTLLRACDELGMLVMDEVRMFGTSPEALRQMRALVKRDRNHPSVVIWSIGNEEFSVHNNRRSFDLASKVSRLLKDLDATRPITYGGCNGANFEGVNGAVEVRGINYIRNEQSADWIDNYHKEHPEQPIVGTEETSYVLSRGSAETDLGSGILDCTGDVVMSWGSTPKGAVKFCAERPYFAGIYMWTGFDYRGEPNPFVYANFSSSFGTIDLSGMEKPPFYYYRSWWTDEPTLKLAPHWNYGKGETARITLYTNCESVRLILNGREIGEYKVEYLDDIRVEIPFEPGELLAIGTKDGREYTDRLVTSGRTASLTVSEVLACESDGDVGIAEICAVDKNGVFCPLSDETVEVSIKEGEIVGVCNGDPADMNPEVPTYREESCLIRTFTYDKGVYSVPSKAQNERKCRFDYITPRTKYEGYNDAPCAVAKFEDTDRKKTDKVYTTVLKGARKYEYVEFERFSVMCDVYLNGKLIGTNSRSQKKTLDYMSRPYRFYCKFKDGDNLLEVRAQLEEDASRPFSGYVKLGRAVKEPMLVNLHYGKARVFVKGVSPAKVKAKLIKNR